MVAVGKKGTSGTTSGHMCDVVMEPGKGRTGLGDFSLSGLVSASEAGGK